MNEYGWTLSDNKLAVVWDTPENVQAIHDRVNLLLKGCKCVTGCKTMRCSCKRKHTHCSEGCQCVNCLNVPRAVGKEEFDLNEIAHEEEVMADVTQLEVNTDELVDWLFIPEVEDAINEELEIVECK